MFLWGSYLSSVAVMFYKDSKIIGGYFNEIKLSYWLIIPLVLLNFYQVLSKWKRDGGLSNKCFLNSALAAIAIIAGIVISLV